MTNTFKIVVSGTREGWKGGEVLSLLTQVRNYLTGEPEVVFDDDGNPFEKYPYGELVHGDALGVDRQAASIWRNNWLGTVKAFPADWKRYGKSAGHKRNAEMLTYALTSGTPFAIVAFQAWNSRGTFGSQRTDYLDHALSLGTPFFWVKSHEWRGQLHAADETGTINV